LLQQDAYPVGPVNSRFTSNGCLLSAADRDTYVRGAPMIGRLLPHREVVVNHFSLLSRFRRIALAGPLLLGGAFNLGCTTKVVGCPATETTQTIDLSQASPAWLDASSDVITPCQASPSDCMPLCERLAYWPTMINSCKRIAVDGGLVVEIAETPPCGE
jgi:hypothetical protein